MTAPDTRRTLRGGRVLRDGRFLYWWGEVLAILAFYGVYSAIRNANGNHPPHALANAKHIISIEHHLGMFHEETIQRWALHFKPLIISANYFYGSFHFIVTIGVAVWLFRKYSDDYPRFRNTLAVTTALALIGFTIFPLMPPRLLEHFGYHTGFVDTLQKYPTRHACRTSSRRCRVCTSRGPRGARSRWSRVSRTVRSASSPGRTPSSRCS